MLLSWTRNFVDRPTLVFLVSFVLLFLAAAILFSLAGKILHRLVQVVLLDWFDRLLGLLLGIVKVGILASLLYMALASTLSASNTLLSRYTWPKRAKRFSGRRTAIWAVMSSRRPAPMSCSGPAPTWCTKAFKPMPWPR